LRRPADVKFSISGARFRLSAPRKWRSGAQLFRSSRKTSPLLCVTLFSTEKSRAKQNSKVQFGNGLKIIKKLDLEVV
jgi:hypothetical protein